MLTPARRRGVEILDEADVDPTVVVRSLGDVVRSNALFGGRRAVLRALAPLFRAAAGTELTLLDVGTGLGDIPWHARQLAARHDVRLSTLGVDLSEPLVRAARARTDLVARADALALPFADATAAPLRGAGGGSAVA